ncbi:hypothetical protein CC78DRAFT_287876 [Lojkania enalia]|uniref:F-box domain-containing protein n=1 Tax=Lojkania enalia TaxID=147567 RepID=A0A9P4K6V0_9PLEO|nr:hypothetical protein CC78DRAFT_287876 [Didymosphaeria enalia]
MFPTNANNQRKPSKSQNNPPKFLSLPLEIRLLICTYVFYIPTTAHCLQRHLNIGLKRLHPENPSLVPSLCLVNHQLHNEALPIYVQSLEIVPRRIETLPPFAEWLDKHNLFRSLLVLDLARFATEHAFSLDIMAFLSRCSNLHTLSLRLDARSLPHPVPQATIVSSFHLTLFISHPSLSALRLAIDLSPPPLPPDPLQELFGMVQSRARRMDNGIMVTKMRVGGRRAYTFYDGVEGTGEGVRDWLIKMWTENGRNVEVKMLGEDRGCKCDGHDG